MVDHVTMFRLSMASKGQANYVIGTLPHGARYISCSLKYS
jgi:hypothetical protein